MSVDREKRGGITVVDDLVQAALVRAEAMRHAPVSTYRLQFHAGFTFRDATKIVPYLHELGVTHLYASPYLKARAGSTHGYDVVDPRVLNPEIGTQADYDAWLAAMRKHGMSHILDTVPNHMGVATNDNPWWNDVLERGRESAYGRFFDIAWRGSSRPQMRDKVLLPVLGAAYGEALEKKELKMGFENGVFAVCYYDRRFPIAPETRELAAKAFEARNDPRGLKLLDELLERQHYRLAWWRVASDEINYRRFFDINDLAAMRMELPEVFETTTEPVLRRVREGSVAGLRIDHPDGLYDPAKYFSQLQEQYLLGFARTEFDNAAKAREKESGGVPSWTDIEPRLRQRFRDILSGQTRGRLPLYVVVEKILGINEDLPGNWLVDGTSGYDFLDMVNGLFVDGASAAEFTRFYEDLIGDNTSFAELAYQKKRLILDISLASELQMLSTQLDDLARLDRHTRDFTLRGLHDALREVIACFAVYRTYVADGIVSEADQRRIEAAVCEASARNPAVDRSIFQFIQSMLLLKPFADASEKIREQQAHFAGKFQQLTAPATAKGIEDTAFYLYNRFISLNEVGGEPGQFGVSAAALHKYFQDRQARWPGGLSPLSTHDTKRSEDVRARINVLSEMPEEWYSQIQQWRQINERHLEQVNGATVPGPNEEYLIYQTLVGAWPVEPAGDQAFAQFVERIKAYLVKASREAKVHTSWTNVNSAYESAIHRFVENILKDRHGAFAQQFGEFQRRVSHFGMINSLAQTTLRLAAPGVPDTYQGTELWDFSLVDPDNRRPVDYEKRQKLLADLTTRQSGDMSGLARELLGGKDDGRIKLFMTSLMLRCRREHRDLFMKGTYLPLKAEGPAAEHIFAFIREHNGSQALVVIPRFTSRLQSGDVGAPVGNAAWGTTAIMLPSATAPLTFKNIFTGRQLSIDPDQAASIPIAQILKDLPVAVLVSVRAET